jgi:predicted dehydrogenase
VNVAIIGAGLQCRRRAPVVRDWPGARLIVIASEHLDHARQQAALYGCEASDDWPSVVGRGDVDIVLVCTPPHLHAEIGRAALQSGKHVLCEKPLTRTVAEAEELVRVAARADRVLKCGFNHRHHPAIAAARQILDRGELGRPLFARCRYGICGRPGYEKEWRADPARAAGGQLVEQGVHAIDLFRWFLGELTEVSGMTARHYFKDMALDDGGMALFRTGDGVTASLHTTLAQWKNLFSFEVFGEEGYAIVEGLGGAYGGEKLITGRRDFTAPFQDVVTHYRGGDVSWKEEWREFVAAIEQGRPPLGHGGDGLAALRLALAVYESEKTGRVVRLPAG